MRRKLVTKDPKTGETVSYGVIAKIRRVDGRKVFLTYDEDRRLWWIAADLGEGFRLAGYREARREICWEIFRDCNRAKLRSILTPPPSN